MMKLIIHGQPDDFILATRAAKALFQSEHAGTIFEFENGDAFYAYRTKRGSLVVRKLPGNWQHETRGG